MEKTVFYQEPQEVFLKKIQECLEVVLKREFPKLSSKEKSPDEFIEMEEVSKILKVSKPTIYKHLEKGFYKKNQVGRKVLFNRTEILNFIKEVAVKSENYLRIGTSYYKKVKKPLASGNHVENLLLWSAEIIRQDHGKAFLAGVSKYDGFCLVPSHLDYKQSVGTFYNLYHKFEHIPKKGYPTKTLQFLNHIFGEQLKLGIDYLKIMLLNPTQRLPILCLVSKERGTGKTTFLNFLKALFGNNMTINSNEDFRSNFNSEWASKLIIGVDETFLDRIEDSERIKNLSTSKYYKVEAKGKDRHEIEFFGKFVLCSNNELTS